MIYVIRKIIFIINPSLQFQKFKTKSNQNDKEERLNKIQVTHQSQ